MGYITLKKIEYGDKSFVFRYPLLVTVTKISENTYSHENDYIDLLSYGNTEEESLGAFKEIFFSYWKNLVLEDDSNLTQDAIDLKLKLKKLVKE